MNVSIGGSYSVALERAVRRALMNDLLIVAAAGNEGMNIDTTKVYPASFQLPHIVSVSAVDAQGGLASYSNYGAYSVAVSAPGDDVISTVPRVVRGSYYEALSGTSMATAYVTGTAALVAAVNHRLTAPLIRDVVIASSQKDAALQGLSISEGYLDAQAAIALAPTRPSMFRFTGSVVNRKGRGVRGVAVTLRAARKRTRRATTRANGTFTISRLAAATYTIRVAKRGYRFAPTEKVLALYQDKRRVFRAKRSGS
jgi:subtilisin family serine protease